MTGRAGRKTRSQRITAAFSPFSIFLIGFGLVWWVLFFATNIQARSTCHFDEIWLARWFEHTAPLQWLGAAVAAIFLLHVVRMSIEPVWRERPVETLMQCVLIAGLVVACGAQKAFFFPHGIPPQSFYDSAIGRAFGSQPFLVEEERVEREWPYDYPPPPPRPNELPHVTNAELFAHADSPYWSELKAVSACSASIDAADKTWREWEEGFQAYMKENGWRYE